MASTTPYYHLLLLPFHPHKNQIRNFRTHIDKQLYRRHNNYYTQAREGEINKDIKHQKLLS